MWIASSSRQELGPGTVDEHDEAREETRVVGEEPGGRDVDVAALVGDAERRSGENRLRHGARAYPLPAAARSVAAAGLHSLERIVLFRGG